MTQTQINEQDITEQNNTTETSEDWLTQEIQNTTKGDFEKLPSLKLQENVPTEIVVDFSKKFETWTDAVSKVVKAIIPVSVNGNRMNWWLNKANPMYHNLLAEYKSKGTTAFKILQTGKQKETKYILLK